MGTGVGQAQLQSTKECGRSRPPESGFAPLASASDPLAKGR